MATTEGKKSILLVNASTKLLALFNDVLEREYNVEVSNFEFESPETIERLHPDLVILDFVNEGAATEWQLLQMIKIYSPTAQIPILLCATPFFVYRESEEYFHQQGIQLLYKPFNATQLLARVHQFFSSSSPDAEVAE